MHHLQELKTQFVHLSVLPKLIYKFDVALIKTP